MGLPTVVCRASIMWGAGGRSGLPTPRLITSMPFDSKILFFLFMSLKTPDDRLSIRLAFFILHLPIWRSIQYYFCLLYTSDAADDLLCVDLGGRRIIKK